MLITKYSFTTWVCELKKIKGKITENFEFLFLMVRSKVIVTEKLQNMLLFKISIFSVEFDAEII